MDDHGLTILGALEELKADIRKMQESHNDENQPMFLIEEGELELKLVAQKSGEAETEFKLYVFNNKLHGTLSKESVQTLKIKFKALGKNGFPPDGIIQTDQSVTMQNTPFSQGGPIVGVDPNDFPET